MDQIKKDKDDGSKPLSEEEKVRQTEEVKIVAGFCQNESQCRRVQILQYFDEVFDKQQCHLGCDVCLNGIEHIARDLTKEAIDVINLVKSMNGNNTTGYCKDVFMGSKKRDIVQKGHAGLDGHGKGSTLGGALVSQLFQELHTSDVLQEHAVRNASGWNNNYIQVGFVPPISAFITRTDCARSLVLGQTMCFSHVKP